MDDSIFRWFNRLADHTTWLHGLSASYAVYGVGAFALLLLLAWTDARRSSEPAAAVAAVVWAGLAPLVGAACVAAIGTPINRARPTTVLRGTHLLIARTTDFSFPSDHTTATVAVAVGLIIASRHLRRSWHGWVALVLALGMGIDRIYVGAHYPSDVLAGIVLGATVAGGLAIPARRLLVPLAARLTTTPLRPLIIA